MQLDTDDATSERRFIDSLKNAGLTNDQMKSLASPFMKSATDRIVQFISTGGFDLWDFENRMRDAFGDCFFGVEDVVHRLNFKVSPASILTLSEPKWSEQVIYSCRKTHLFVADVGSSVLNLRERAPKHFFHGYKSAWYNEHPFASECSSVRWRLLRKEPVEVSGKQSWRDQLGTIPPGETVPSARTLAYAAVSYHSLTGERLFPGKSIRTSTLAPMRKWGSEEMEDKRIVFEWLHETKLAFNWFISDEACEDYLLVASEKVPYLD